MEIRETVQRNVARYIKGSDYTQAEIARMLGVSKPTVTNWIKGVNTPNIELLNQLCRILNIYFMKCSRKARMRTRRRHQTSSSLLPTTAHSTMREKKRSASTSQT